MKPTIIVTSIALGGLLLLATACGGDSQETGADSDTTALPRVSSETTGALPTGVGLVGSNQQVGLWVTGVGEVTVVPDLALLSLGVEAEARTAAVARNQAAEAMQDIFDLLEDEGLADRDIQTGRFSIQPIRAPRERIITGYRVTNLVTIKVRDLDRLGPLVDGVTEAGGDLTRVQSISFTVDGPAPLQREARDKAMQNALEKAQQYANLAGVKLGKPLLIQERGGGGLRVPEPVARAFIEAAPLAPTPISPGETKVSVSV